MEQITERNTKNNMTDKNTEKISNKYYTGERPLFNKSNLEIDKQLFDKDYRSVFAEAISNQVVINARNKAKNWLYLLQEDLKNTEAVKISKFTGRPVINKRTSVDIQDSYHTISQDNTLKQVYGFTRRLI